MSTPNRDSFDDLPILAELREALDDRFNQRRRRGSAGRQRAGRWLRATVRGVPVALAVVVVVAIAVVSLTLGSHGRSPTPIRTTDAVPASPSTAAKLRLGTPAGPETADPNRFQGAAIPSTVKLVAETPDPHGGLPWGLREFQTTRGATCLQVGRVQSGTIGVIGQDGAWANDHRFHPISPNAYTGDRCSPTDRDGHTFNNVSDHGAIASANVPWGAGLQGDGCAAQVGGRQQPPCPRADLRDLDYGLLGPDAVSITYSTESGHLFTEPTNPPDGAYLIVGRATGQQCVLVGGVRRGCSSGGGTSGPGLQSGVITSVRYRDGQVCQLPAPTSAGVEQASCPAVGYVAPEVGHVNPAQVTAPITVRKLPAKHYCTSGPLSLAPCKAGQTALKGGQGMLLIEISFTARVGVTNGNSYYEFSDSYPGPGRKGCAGSGSSGPTNANIRPGQRVVFQDQISRGCTGVVHGTVAYVPNSGAAGLGSGSSRAPGRDGSVLVGRFSFVMP